LLEETLGLRADANGVPRVWLEPRAGDAVMDLPWRIANGYVWTTLGVPVSDVFAIPEYLEPDRRNLDAGSIGVHTSAPRAIENFLDMAHFPYVHTGILGAEPHTEVPEYDVVTVEETDEILATRCRFFQPMAAAAAASGAFVDYTYRVPHPYCAVLYKTSPLDTSRRDVIALFLQPVDQEHVRAHMLLSLFDESNDDRALRRFQQLIFSQDKPVLENQLPRRLPLDPRAETPIRADKSSVAYRRWLRRKGIVYGTIPAAA
jgi:phenylpropionate dioxygenase-like ring-hydroxylating dioxygenase large terminal subunit